MSSIGQAIMCSWSVQVKLSRTVQIKLRYMHILMQCAKVSPIKSHPRYSDAK